MSESSGSNYLDHVLIAAQAEIGSYFFDKGFVIPEFVNSGIKFDGKTPASVQLHRYCTESNQLFCAGFDPGTSLKVSIDWLNKHAQQDLLNQLDSVAKKQMAELRQIVCDLAHSCSPIQSKTPASTIPETFDTKIARLQCIGDHLRFLPAPLHRENIDIRSTTYEVFPQGADNTLPMKIDLNGLDLNSALEVISLSPLYLMVVKELEFKIKKAKRFVLPIMLPDTLQGFFAVTWYGDVGKQKIQEIKEFMRAYALRVSAWLQADMEQKIGTLTASNCCDFIGTGGLGAKCSIELPDARDTSKKVKASYNSFIRTPIEFQKRHHARLLSFGGQKLKYDSALFLDNFPRKSLATEFYALCNAIQTICDMEPSTKTNHCLLVKELPLSSGFNQRNRTALSKHVPKSGTQSIAGLVNIWRVPKNGSSPDISVKDSSQLHWIGFTKAENFSEMEMFNGDTYLVWRYADNKWQSSPYSV
jgi:hypothetical protein